MALGTLLNLIRQKYLPEEGQLLMRSLHQDPLVWEFIQDKDNSSTYFNSIQDGLKPFSPGEISRWIISQQFEGLPQITLDVQIPGDILAQAKQVFQTTISTGLPPSDLGTAGLLAINLIDRRQQKNSWRGLADEIFTKRNPQTIQVFFQIWRTPFACLFQWCEDFEGLTAELLQSETEIVTMTFLPVIIHSLLANPLTQSQLVEKLVPVLKTLTIDMQLEALRWVNAFKQIDLQENLASQLLQTKTNRDFLIQVFSELEAFNAVNPQIDPLERKVRFNLPEDLNRLAAFYHFTGNPAKAIDTYQESCALLAFLEAQTKFQILAGETNRVTASRWLDIVKSIPHSKRALQFHIRTLIQDQQFDEAQRLIDELPESIEKRYLQSKLISLEPTEIGSLITQFLDFEKNKTKDFRSTPGYFVHQTGLIKSNDIQQIIIQNEADPVSVEWVERYLDSNFNDPQAVEIALNLYEKYGKIDKSIETAAYLEQVEPNNIQHKKTLGRLLVHAKRWNEAFTFLQDLIKIETNPAIEDLERYAESALKSNEIDIAMTVSHNIIKREPQNKKALVLLGEGYFHKGDQSKAIQHMEAVIKMIPGTPTAWLTLAWLWQEAGQINRQLEILKQGINVNPNQPKLLRAYGKALLDQKEYSNALIALQKAHELEPNHQDGKFNLAQTYYLLGQTQNSYEILVDFIDNYQENPQAARLLGKVLIALEKYDIAEPILLFAAESFPDDEETVLTATQLVLDRIEQTSMSKTEKLLDQVESLLKDRKKTFGTLLQIANVARLKGEFEKAFDIYTQLAKDSTDDTLGLQWRVNYGLGASAMGLKKYEVALAALQMAIDDQPGNLIIRHALADSLLIADLPGKAHSIAGSALKLSPYDLNNILWYADFKTRADQPGEAVRALKEALQITPNKHELKLRLAKALISEQSIDEANETIANFIKTDESDVDQLREAAHLCVHLNNLPLAIEALSNANCQAGGNNPLLVMELSVIHSLMQENKKALDILDIDQNQLFANPEMALIKSDLLSKVGQYDAAYRILKLLEGYIDNFQKDDTVEEIRTAASPLLYIHDLTLKGYYFRMGLLARALGFFEDSQTCFSLARRIDSEDLELVNLQAESALINLEYLTALNILSEFNLPGSDSSNLSSTELDLVCTRIETLLHLGEVEQAEKQIPQISKDKENSPRLLALSSQLAVHRGDILLAKEYLQQAHQQYLQTLTTHENKSLSVLFHETRVLNTIAEANLALEHYQTASDAWSEITKFFKSQHLFNWRYLYSLIVGAEAQQIAEAVSLKTHAPGLEFLSGESYVLAQSLLDSLTNVLSQDQVTILKARMISAFTGKWPTQINIDAFLQGPEEAAAILLGSDNPQLASDILEAYPDHLRVLQAYGIFSLRNEIKNASQQIEKALSVDPTNPINFALLAKLSGDTEQALRSIETALNFWPDEDGWQYFAADLYQQAGDQISAQAHIAAALEKQPKNPRYWEMSAMLKVDVNELEDAKIDLKKSAAIQSDNPNTWVKMAEINRRMGDLSTAIENIKKARQLDPDIQTFEDMELQLLTDQKNYQGLEQKAREVLAKNPQRESALFALGRALANQGKFDQALQALQKPNNNELDSPRLLLERIKIKKQQLGVNPVLPELVALAEKYPNDPEVLTALTDWLIQSNRLDQAEEAAQMILRIVPDQAEVYVMLGRLQRMKGKLDQAIAHLSEAINIDPRLVDSYIELGKTYQDRRDLEKAIEAYQMGSKANRYDPRPYYFAGLALKDNKDYQNAEVMLKQAKYFAPDDPNIVRQLGVVSALNLLNNLREAK